MSIFQLNTFPFYLRLLSPDIGCCLSARLCSEEGLCGGGPCRIRFSSWSYLKGECDQNLSSLFSKLLIDGADITDSDRSIFQFNTETSFSKMAISPPFTMFRNMAHWSAIDKKLFVNLKDLQWLGSFMTNFCIGYFSLWFRGSDSTAL